jgi:hypothetical protein
MVPPAAELSTGRWLDARLLCFLGCRAELSDRKIVRSDRTRRNRAARPGHHVKMWLSGGGFGGDAVAHRYQLCDVVARSAFGVDPGGVVVGAEVVEPGGGVVEPRVRAQP